MDPKACAEWIIRQHDEDHDEAAFDGMDDMSILNMLYPLAKAYLAHLSVGTDDDTLITAEWLTACGYPDNGDGSHTITRAGLVEVVWYQRGVAATHSSQLCLYLYPTPGILTRKANATRGDLRRLCAALDAEFKETT